MLSQLSNLLGLERTGLPQPKTHSLSPSLSRLSEEHVRIIVYQEGDSKNNTLLFDSHQQQTTTADTSHKDKSRGKPTATTSHSFPSFHAYSHAVSPSALPSSPSPTSHKARQAKLPPWLSEMMFGTMPMVFLGTNTKLHFIYNPPSTDATSSSSSSASSSRSSFSSYAPLSTSTMPGPQPLSPSKILLTKIIAFRAAAATAAEPLHSHSAQHLHQHRLRSRSFQRSGHGEERRKIKFCLGVFFYIPEEIPCLKRLILSHFPILNHHANKLLSSLKARLCEEVTNDFRPFNSESTGSGEILVPSVPLLGAYALQQDPKITFSVRSYQRAFCALFATPRLHDPLWAAITSHNGCEERFSQSLVKALQELHDMCDNSKNNFFLTMLITSLLSNHLSWLTSISSPTSQAPSPSSPSSPISTPESPHKEYANSTIAHQLDTLNGSFGKCTKATRLIIVGSDEPLIKALLFVLTYFIRGHDLTAVSRQPCSPTCLYSNRSIEHLCSLSPSSLPHSITATTATPASTFQETSGITYKGLKTCELSANCKLDVVLMPDNGGEDHLSNGRQKAESNNTNGNSNRGRSSSISAAKTKHLRDASCSCLFRSLCAAYSKLGYSSDFTLLGFAATKNEEAHAIASSAQIAKADANSMDHHSWFPALVDDLRSQVAHPLLPSSQTRATVRSSSCIIADTNSWTCNLVTYNPWNLTRQPFKWKGREYRGVFVDTVAHSQFLHSVMWTISEFHKTGLSSEACLLYVEDKLQELYAHSNVLLEFIGSQQLPETSSAPTASAGGSMSGAPPMVTLSDMSTALGFGLGDLILLLSIACTKNPSIVDALHPVDILREGTLNNILPVS